ncbi:MAG TPA: methyltransferase domain-containing protein [Steroidobacter sp.]|nr:methyltransferase domain-containing protein [Steroidobacter sp.]
MIRLRRLIFNAATFAPGVMHLPAVKRVLMRRALGARGTGQARYCYAVWLRHLRLAAAHGLGADPRFVAELGPGESVGAGLAALLCGAERYYAFDVVAHANATRNLAVFEELVRLFQQRAPIPENNEFPHLGPTLDDYAFPEHILTADRMGRALQPERIERIRASLHNRAARDSLIQYRAPWTTHEAVEPQTLDMVYSQAALEHVDGLLEVYTAMFQWLKPGGYISHQIDFNRHDAANEWNGHWTYSDPMWALVRGKDVWLINREPYSTHQRLIKDCGFDIVAEQLVRRRCALRRRQLARRFRHLSDQDLTTSDAFIQAVKPGAAAPTQAVARD